MTNDNRKQAPPFGFLTVLALAAVLCVAVLGIAATTEPGGGEAAFGNAMEGLFAVVALWIVLAILLAVGGVMGNMPGRAAVAAIFLVPMAGVASFVALDMCSRHMRWAIALVALPPLLVAFYAAWARLPVLRTKMPAATRVAVAVWGAVLALSAVTFLAAM
jgi:hypothetical protein